MVMVLMTAFASVETAREAFKLGAAEALRDELVAAKDRSAERFLSADLLELLLTDSEAAQPDDPRAGLCNAELAVALASKQYDPYHLADDAMVRALRLRANALRLMREPDEAEDDLSEALNFLAADSQEMAPFHLACGLLQIDLHNLPGATAHLQEAARHYVRRGAQAQQGTCLLLAGLTCVANDDSDRALFQLMAGWKQVDLSWHPRLSRRAGFTYVRLAAEAAGVCAKLREDLDKVLALCARIQDDDLGEQLEAQRLEAAARARFGETAAALKQLRDVFHQEIERDDLLGSTLAALELSCLLAPLGQAEQCEVLIRDLERLEDTVGRAPAQEAVRSFWFQTGKGWGPGRAASRVEAEFRRQCRLLGAPLGEPFDFA